MQKTAIISAVNTAYANQYCVTDIKNLVEAKNAAYSEIEALLATDLTDSEKTLVDEAINAINEALSIAGIELIKADFNTKWKVLHKTEDPGESTNCDHLCHKSGFPGFIWKIVNFFNRIFGTNKTCTCGASHY